MNPRIHVGLSLLVSLVCCLIMGGVAYGQALPTDTTPVGARRFLGQFGNGTVRLTLTNLPPHTSVTVSLDLFIIQSWDGNDTTYGPDIWELNVTDGPTLLHTTFSVGFWQAYPDAYPGGDHPARTGAAENDTLGYTGDSVYQLNFTFPHTASSLALNFSAFGLQSLGDESWGLDNVAVQGDSNGIYNNDFEGGVGPEWAIPPSTVVTIPDPNLEAALREALGKPTDPLTEADLQSLTHFSAPNHNIANLTGLEFATNLVELILFNNQIADVSPLANLTNLTNLDLQGNSIRDIGPLANLTHLTVLGLGGNQIANISVLVNLTNLQWLTLWGSQIDNFSPLANLTNLTYLDLGGTQIGNQIGQLVNLTNLTELFLYYNGIGDISLLTNLTNLTYLNLAGNQITDISALSGLIHIGGHPSFVDSDLDLSYNNISNIQPLVDNPGIDAGDVVNLTGNSLSDESIGKVNRVLRPRGVKVLGVPIIVPDIEGPHALSLDGDGDLVEVTNVHFSYQALTLEAWVYMNDSNTIREIIGTPDNNNSFQLEIWEGRVIMFDAVTDATRLITEPDTFQLKKWHHIAGVYDGTTSIIYVDGKPVVQGSATGSSDLVDATIRIGSETYGGSQFWYGLLDEVRVWNVARTQADIQSTMNTTLHGDEPGLVGYWNFDDGTARDRSPNGNHGTLVGDAGIMPLVRPWFPPIGDVSGDGKITAFDASLILQYVVGLIDHFPADALASPPDIAPRDYTLSVAEVSAKMGQRVTVPVRIADTAGLTAGGIRLTYDPNVLKAVDVTTNLTLNGAYWKANPSLNGEVRFAFVTTEPPTPALPGDGEGGRPDSLPLQGEGRGGGTLFNVEFEVLPAPEGRVSPLTLESVELAGSKHIHTVDGTLTVLPSRSVLLQNYPNPFNPETWLPYQLSAVTIAIYDSGGRFVRQLDIGSQRAGVYIDRQRAAYWDGRNEAGERVGSGIYFYHLRAGGYSDVRKLVILK
ncbi:leucine-rich repeat domain-containing protein [Candidatus Poribacteria bacterium]|nr:leucine-rich repeat domain-containing protein [Candidatus Poribacteria bacterium]